jgi:adenylate cyclase
LRRELLALAAELRGFDAAVGVSAGTVVAGNIGSADRYEYTVIGRPVHEAARLTEAAKQRLGRVLASDEVVERANGEAASWHVAGEMTLRGFTDPIRTYEPAPLSRTEAPAQ